MKSTRIVLLLSALVVACPAQFTAIYEFPTAATDVPSVANVQFTALTGVNVVLSYAAATQNTTTNQWTPSGSSADTSEYLSLTLKAATGYELTLTQFALKQSRTTAGPTSISVGLFVDGVQQEVSSAITTFQTGQTGTASMMAHSFDFADVGPLVSTSTAEFRIYGWGGTTVSGQLRLDDLAISGSVAASAIPEPSAWAAILGLVALAGVVMRRRRDR